MKISVVGAGISGLATAFAIQQQACQLGLDLALDIFEKEDCPGGKIRSEKVDGYLCEWGPNGFLDSKPMTLELCREAGLAEQLLRSNDAARKRFIFSGGVCKGYRNRLPTFFAPHWCHGPASCGWRRSCWYLVAKTWRMRPWPISYVAVLDGRLLIKWLAPWLQGFLPEIPKP